MAYLAACASAPADRVDIGSGVAIEMVRIPAGEFVMGSPATEPDHNTKEEPQRTVRVKSFWISPYEITQEQWNLVMTSTPGDPRHAMTNVSWTEANEFATKLTASIGRRVRLPSEAEWEYVCRARSATAFATGDRITRAQSTFDPEKTRAQSAEAYWSNGGSTPRQQPGTGEFPPNAFGVYDMSGGVWEWTADSWHDRYAGAPSDQRPWVDRGDSVQHPVRGGAWDTAMHRQRCAYRDAHGASEKFGNLGFRIVVEY